MDDLVSLAAVKQAIRDHRPMRRYYWFEPARCTCGWEAENYDVPFYPHVDEELDALAVTLG